MRGWIEEYNGMRGTWKEYYCNHKDPTEPYHGPTKVFCPIGAGECPHDTYEVDSVSVNTRYQRKDGTFADQYITAYACCDDCGTYGEFQISANPESLKRDYRWIDWSATRAGVFVGWKDDGYWDWIKRQPDYVPPPEDAYKQARLDALAEVGIIDSVA